MAEGLSTKQRITSDGNGNVIVENGGKKHYNLNDHDQQVRFFTDTSIEWKVMMALVNDSLPRDVYDDLEEAVSGIVGAISFPHELVKLLIKGAYTVEL